MFNFFKNNLWLIALHLVIFIIVVVNFPLGKYFIGWDSLSPEFNIPLNITRALFPFWQENYGLGTLTGHGFAATLPHTLLIGLLSIALPEWSLRSVFTFLCYYSGGVGMYFLVRYLLQKLNTLKNFNTKQFIPVISFIGALFYLLNIGTVQVFYIQLEAFIGQYATLPWLFLSIFCVLDRGKKQDYLFLLITSFVASIQGFIPSLFVTYFVSLLVILCSYFLTHRSKWGIGKVVAILIITFLTNMYWLLPVIYFQLSRGANFLASYNNLSSTPHFIELSSKFGNLGNVALLKSYLFDSYQLGGYILHPWISQFNSSIVLGIGYGVFVLIVAGLIISIFKLRSYYIYALTIIFTYVFSSIAISTLPFSLVNNLLKTISPTYEQAFRTTFTKFGISLSFLYSIELCIALFIIAQLLQRFKGKIIAYITILLTILAIFYYALPIFSGNLLYKKLELNIPPAYTELMTYMKSQPEGRIADLPQYCSDGWYAYNWGYFGSGFLWYGIEQPFLSRSFDVWSNNNENYYWELSQALAQQDYKKVDLIFKKYNVRWIMYDPNITSCLSQKGIMENNQLFLYLKSSKKYSTVKTFNNGLIHPITVIKNDNLVDNAYVSGTNNLRNIGPSSKWIDSDINNDTYYTTSKEKYSEYNPYRSLLSKRGMNNGSNPVISITDGSISFKTNIPKSLNGYYLSVAAYKNVEKILPIQFTFEKAQEDYQTLFITQHSPQISLDDKNLLITNRKIAIGTLSSEEILQSEVYINGQKIQKDAKNQYTSAFVTDQNNVIQIFNNDEIVFNWNSENEMQFNNTISQSYTNKVQEYSQGDLELTFPIISDDQYFGSEIKNVTPIQPSPCNEIKPNNRNIFEVNMQPKNAFVRMISQNSTQCMKFNFPNLPTNRSYILAVKSRNIAGNLPKTSLYTGSNLVYSDLVTGKAKKSEASYYVIPSTSLSGLGYRLEIENSSHSEVKSINELYSVALYPIPYNFIKEVGLVDGQTGKSSSEVSVAAVDHKNPTLYRVELKNNAQMITLAQNYDEGWNAYVIDKNNSKFITSIQEVFPFVFGKKLSSHVLVNNWSNGWKIDSSLTNRKYLVIVYLPQYLGYLNFMTLGLFTFAFLYLVHEHSLSYWENRLNNYFEEQTKNVKKRIDSLLK